MLFILNSALNNTLLDKSKSDHVTYLSVDLVVVEVDYAVHYPIKFLQTLNQPMSSTLRRLTDYVI